VYGVNDSVVCSIDINAEQNKKNTCFNQMTYFLILLLMGCLLYLQYSYSWYERFFTGIVEYPNNLSALGGKGITHVRDVNGNLEFDNMPHYRDVDGNTWTNNTSMMVKDPYGNQWMGKTGEMVYKDVNGLVWWKDSVDTPF
jgi:hypothetical protein